MLLASGVTRVPGLYSRTPKAPPGTGYPFCWLALIGARLLVKRGHISVGSGDSPLHAAPCTCSPFAFILHLHPSPSSFAFVLRVDFSPAPPPPVRCAGRYSIADVVTPEDIEKAQVLPRCLSSRISHGFPYAARGRLHTRADLPPKNRRTLGPW